MADPVVPLPEQHNEDKMPDLLEDADGAPLPPELQPGSPIYDAVLRWCPGGAWPGSRKADNTTRIMVALAPVLWPMLTSNDNRGAVKARLPMDELSGWEELAEGLGGSLRNHEIGCSGEYQTYLYLRDGTVITDRDVLTILDGDR